MSRPLIIKVDNHKVKSAPRATGLLNPHILKQINFDEKPNDANDEQFSDLSKLKSSSLVRNLISQYETCSAPETTTLKYKSKSLVDLQKPKPQFEAKTQDDYFLNRKKYKEDKDEDINEDINFKKAFSMFQKLESGTVNRSPSSKTATPRYKKEVKTAVPRDSVDISVIKQKAFMLLETQPSFEQISYDFSWQSKVINLLEDITMIDAKHVTVPKQAPANEEYFDEFDPLQRQDSAELAYRIEDNNNSYIEANRILTKPAIIYADEDAVKEGHLQNGEYDKDAEASEQIDNEEEEDFSDSASSGTIQSVSPTFEEQNRLDYLESCKQLLEDLVKDVQEYESKIEFLDVEDENGGRNIQNVIGKILAELKDVRIDPNEELMLVKKKDAIDYAEKCIKKLEKLQPGLSSS